MSREADGIESGHRYEVDKRADDTSGDTAIEIVQQEEQPPTEEKGGELTDEAGDGIESGRQYEVDKRADDTSGDTANEIVEQEEKDKDGELTDEAGDGIESGRQYEVDKRADNTSGDTENEIVEGEQPIEEKRGESTSDGEANAEGFEIAEGPDGPGNYNAPPDEQQGEKPTSLEEGEKSTGKAGDGVDNGDDFVVDERADDSRSNIAHQTFEEEEQPLTEEETGESTGDGEANAEGSEVAEGPAVPGIYNASSDKPQREQPTSLEEVEESTGESRDGVDNGDDFAVDERTDDSLSDIALQTIEQHPTEEESEVSTGDGEANAEGFEVAEGAEDDVDNGDDFAVDERTDDSRSDIAPEEQPPSEEEGGGSTGDGETSAVSFDVADGAYGSDITLQTEARAEEARSQKIDILRNRRSRTSSITRSVISDEDDDGSICQICAEKWEIEGDRRICALTCGHMFCAECLDTWIDESIELTSTKVCPVCKVAFRERSIICLYPYKRTIDVVALSKLHEEITDQRRLCSELRREVEKLKPVLAGKQELLKKEKARTKELFKAQGRRVPREQQMHELKLKCTVNIAREHGSRVLVHSERFCSLVVSQKSDMGPNDEYGIRFVDTPTFVPDTFIRISRKPVRDMCLCADQNSVVIASMERTGIIYDYRSPREAIEINSFGPQFWSCDADRGAREHMLYMGSHCGGILTYDMRYDERAIKEYVMYDDRNAVLNIAAVNAGPIFPYGGFIVCTEQSVIFFEYTNAGNESLGTKLIVEGPFRSINYDYENETLVVMTRSLPYRWSRYFFGRLKRRNNKPFFEIKATFLGTKNSPYVSRCAQMMVEENTYIAAYLQHEKYLRLFNVEHHQMVQSIPVRDVIHDICTVKSDGSILYVAALIDNKCQIYTVSAQED